MTKYLGKLLKVIIGPDQLLLGFDHGYDTYLTPIQSKHLSAYSCSWIDAMNKSLSNNFFG